MSLPPIICGVLVLVIVGCSVVHASMLASSCQGCRDPRTLKTHFMIPLALVRLVLAWKLCLALEGWIMLYRCLPSSRAPFNHCPVATGCVFPIGETISMEHRRVRVKQGAVDSILFATTFRPLNDFYMFKLTKRSSGMVSSKRKDLEQFFLGSM